MSSCQQCVHMVITIRQSEGDLAGAARRAARNPTERLVAQVDARKAERDRRRQVYADHLAHCTGDSVPA